MLLCLSLRTKTRKVLGKPGWLVTIQSLIHCVDNKSVNYIQQTHTPRDRDREIQIYRWWGEEGREREKIYIAKN
jgi:hypothetical protein